jgi:hypothetical protein
MFTAARHDPESDTRISSPHLYSVLEYNVKTYSNIVFFLSDFEIIVRVSMPVVPCSYISFLTGMVCITLNGKIYC